MQDGMAHITCEVDFCSTAAKAGKIEHQIMKQTRHKKSDFLHRYIKKATLFNDNVASGIVL